MNISCRKTYFRKNMIINWKKAIKHIFDCVTNTFSLGTLSYETTTWYVWSWYDAIINSINETLNANENVPAYEYQNRLPIEDNIIQSEIKLTTCPRIKTRTRLFSFTKILNCIIYHHKITRLVFLISIHHHIYMNDTTLQYSP